MNVDAYCCSGCGYFEVDRPSGAVPGQVACPRCFTRSSRLHTPVVYARTNPAVRVGVLITRKRPDVPVLPVAVPA